MEEINRLGWYQTVYESAEVQARAIERMDRMRRGDNLCQEEWEIVRADGQTRTVCISTAVLTTEDKGNHVLGVMHDNTERRAALISLEKAHHELEVKNSEMERFNIALGVLLDQRAKDKADLENSILSNIKLLVLPEIENLNTVQLSESQAFIVKRLRECVEKLTSNFTQRLTGGAPSLTPTEIRIADMVKSGLRTKEIAELLAVAPSTVLSHRENLRRKLDLRGKKMNLTSFLRSLE